MIKTLLEELEKRGVLAEAIDSIIDSTYISAPGEHIRRGAVQEFILSELKLQRNNMLCSLINQRMTAKGFRPIINRGDQYYRGCIINHQLSN
jgi:hypothetical protein